MSGNCSANDRRYYSGGVMVRVVTSLTHHRREIYFSTLCYIMSHSRRRLRGERRFRRRSVASEPHKKRLPDRSLALGVERLHLALGLPVPVLRGEERGVGSAEMKMVRMSKEKRGSSPCCGYFSVSGGGAAGCRGPAIARRGSGSACLEAYLPDGTGDEAEAQADSGLRGHVHLGSCAWTGGGKWSDAVARGTKTKTNRVGFPSNGVAGGFRAKPARRGCANASVPLPKY